MAWEKLPALEKPGFRSGCMNCGPQPVTLDLETELCVGFGQCVVMRGETEMYSEQPGMHPDEVPKLSLYEDMATRDPDHDWRVRFWGPMSETEYQRHGPAQWVLVKKGEGFA